MRCVLCNYDIKGAVINGEAKVYGHNPAPLADEGRCCDQCNLTKVAPARFVLKIYAEAEIMQAREESNHSSKSELVRIKSLEKLVIILADVIDRMNKNKESV
jgi:hypothetical protein